ncbi:MAG TPA: GNAT family N-acetyltransferase [Cellvibrionaceae bacterium]|nr:GNAT family N-acetyltransferase [Cellvibrionaceae bacterium]HMW47892.1 GNAT family N-acetyltransferase [Cellvibrionaceae bacterium]HMW70463.1 GNAT family N-acetyltransferase [Cellvibrionaceae bacterium]HMY39347.1 GNAT family N-acetyltransferase [Marinagarivorans sp.]HNG61077.1 GNAT family N-acetyltransferase [Cellvibrionaceae bacterium]
MNASAWNHRYKLVNLSAAPHCLPAIAAWQHDQWVQTLRPKQADLFTPAPNIPADALQERQSQLRQHLGANLIPTTFVLLEKGRAVGSVSLVNYRRQNEKTQKTKPLTTEVMDGQAGDKDAQSIWLTNMYVLPEHRKQGLAQVLLNRAEDYARSLQLKHIYLYAQDAEGYYKKRGWLVLKTVNLDGQKLKVLVRHL